MQLRVLLQALEDILSFELGLPLCGLSADEDPEDVYAEALAFISRYPTLVKRWQEADKKRWLKELTDAREDTRSKAGRHLPRRR